LRGCAISGSNPRWICHPCPPRIALGGAGPAGDRAIALIAAQVVVVATPVYRASYSGLLKVFFDLFAEDALADRVAVPIAVGGGAGHLLAIDHGLRPLLTSLGATVVPGGVYGTPAGFADSGPTPALLERVDRAVVEAVSLAAATAWRLDSQLPERQVRHARAS
jgi:FMN reductase